MHTGPEQKGVPKGMILEAKKSTTDVSSPASGGTETQPGGCTSRADILKSWIPNPKWYGTLVILTLVAFHMLYLLLEVWKEGVLVPSPFIPALAKPYSLAGNEILIGAVIASIMGGLGSIIFCFKSIFDGVERGSDTKAVYLALLFRPIYGALLALIFYFLVRGGLIAFSGGSMNIPAKYPDIDLMRASTAGVSGLVGMFSEQAMTKLKEFFDSLFAVKTS
ncbi:MAG TPA: hypothetical protein ACFYEA_07185 [Candidatus Tripitaka californicus]|uniref:hypothetical protein n=2 Tax=Candidatus Tripitaka californicus TaxID=3367616 RepID=UPI004028035C|nr:hypothetical protein [Planctomycetota bacterium]